MNAEDKRTLSSYAWNDNKKKDKDAKMRLTVLKYIWSCLDFKKKNLESWQALVQFI